MFVQWNDNHPVIVGTNCDGVEPTGFVKRWSSKEKKEISVRIPHVVQSYNKYMGGVDLCDRY